MSPSKGYWEVKGDSLLVHPDLDEVVLLTDQLASHSVSRLTLLF